MMKVVISLITVAVCIFVLQTLEVHGTRRTFEEFRSKTIDLIDKIDEAKEKSIGCRYIVRLAEESSDSSIAEKREMKLTVPTLVKNCFESIENLLQIKFKQMNAVIKRIDLRSAEVRTARLSDHVGPKITGSEQFKERIEAEALALGDDYCVFLTTGFLGDTIKLIRHIQKSTISQFIPDRSPMKNFEALRLLKPNSHLVHLLTIADGCNKKDFTSYKPSGLIGLLGSEPTCSRINIFLLQKLYRKLSADDAEDIKRKLMSLSQSIFTSCLENLSEVKARYNINDKLTESDSAKFIASELINYLNDEFLEGNLLDRLNARSFIKNNIEYNIFFNQKVQKQLWSMPNEVQSIHLYQHGQGLCDANGTNDYFSDQNVLKELYDSMLKLYSLMGISNLLVDLTSLKDNQDFQWFILSLVCQDIKLREIKIPGEIITTDSPHPTEVELYDETMWTFPSL